MKSSQNVKVVVIVPAFNEELTIQKVVQDFLDVEIVSGVVVVDNKSTDQTSSLVKKMPEYGSRLKLITETKQGKGFAIRRAFRLVDADYYVMVDADDTYLAIDLLALYETCHTNEFDMVVGNRLANQVYADQNTRPLHNFGNLLIKRIINYLYKSDVQDILSGFRVFNRDFVKNYPIQANGFELETEMTLFALDKNYSMIDIPISYKERPAGSVSKLNTFADGRRILFAIVRIYRLYQPLRFFGGLSLLFYTAGLLFGIPAISDYLYYRYVYHLPLTLLASTLVLVGTISLVTAFILDAIADSSDKNFEMNRLGRR